MPGLASRPCHACLNSPEKVNEATRARVLAAIDRLGFVPKAEAAARARKDHGRIGVLAPFFTLPSFVERLRGVANALDDSPYELAIYNVDSSARRDGYLASLPVTRRLDGLIIMALPFDQMAAQRLAEPSPGNRADGVFARIFSSIRIDDRAGGQTGGRVLASEEASSLRVCGRCRTARLRHSHQRLALGGISRSLDRQPACSCREEYVALAPHSRENARLSAHRLLDLPEPPTAIFAASDNQALGVLKAARERRLSIPNELAVIGFDDVDIADFVGLTTIRQPLEESGRVAVDLLLARLVDPSRPPQHIRLPLTLVRRETA